VPRENGSDDAEAAICADIGTSRAVMDAAKHQGLASLPGFPFEVRTSASTRAAPIATLSPEGRRFPVRRHP